MWHMGRGWNSVPLCVCVTPHIKCGVTDEGAAAGPPPSLACVPRFRRHRRGSRKRITEVGYGLVSRLNASGDRNPPNVPLAFYRSS